MYSRVADLGDCNRSKTAHYAQGANREELSGMIGELEKVQVVVSSVLPVLKFLLSDTPTKKQKAKLWARLDAEEGALSGAVN
jgi:hypothetical protein